MEIDLIDEDRWGRARNKAVRVGGGRIAGEAENRPFEMFDDDGLEPVDTPSFAYGNFQLVGHGEVTSAKCGRFTSFWGCLRVDLHDLITLEGRNYRGKVYMRKVFNSCDKPSCAVCYKYGWAVREAGNIERRLAEGARRFGQVEHIVCSVPVKDYGLSYLGLRRKVVKILKKAGVLGGALIFHGFRFNWEEFWYWGPHFHVLGYIEGGYRRCRRCRWGTADCRECGGILGRCYGVYDETGYIVRVLDERETVGGTAWYQLNHSSIDVSKKRFHVATWFGVVSYRKLKLTPEKRRKICPICRHELVKVSYRGSDVDIKACYLLMISDRGEKEFIADYREFGEVVWFENAVKYGY